MPCLAGSSACESIRATQIWRQDKPPATKLSYTVAETIRNWRLVATDPGERQLATVRMSSPDPDVNENLNRYRPL
jgi:hypothetical protein